MVDNQKKEVPSKKNIKRKNKRKQVSKAEQTMEILTQSLLQTIKENKEPQDEWELVNVPMSSDIDDEEAYRNRILQPESASKAGKPLRMLSTDTYLDTLFLDSKNQSLGGIPLCGQFAVTGLPGAGKSILVEEIALKVSSTKRKVLFVTSEDVWRSPSPRLDLQARMKQKGDILNLEWANIKKHLFVLDTVSFPELKDWSTFAETYRFVNEKESIDLAIIDSVTILESYRGALKYRVSELSGYNQVKGVTGLFVNQRSSEHWDNYDMAGGIGIAHNLDGTIVIDYGRIYWSDQQNDLDEKRGTFVRIMRILDCRLCNFENKRQKIEITSNGFIRPV